MHGLAGAGFVLSGSGENPASPARGSRAGARAGETHMWVQNPPPAVQSNWKTPLR